MLKEKKKGLKGGKNESIRNDLEIEEITEEQGKEFDLLDFEDNNEDLSTLFDEVKKIL